ncbi:hypothetical protein PFISCL1PPCAC_10388, partial [Pristionchus fissidentatus]
RMTALYGTSFEELDDEERDAVSKKPTSIQDQVATDERGRRRFHGAFTGGFSAGYFNTVGSKHGWAPSEFRSTRDERADKNSQRAEDYMDEEDLGEYGISSRRIRTTKEFSSGLTLAWERGSEGTTTQSAVEGIFAKDLQIAVKDVSDSVGIRMLREMGWRQGRAVGLTTIREAKKHRNLDDVDREQITKVAPHWVASAEDEEVIHLDPLEGKKGLGYSGELKGSGLLNEKYGQSAAMLKGKKGRGMQGQAFGVGAFEDEDESVYTSFDLSQYDFALGPAAPEGRDAAPDSSFVPARSVLSSRKFYGAPKIPPTFKGIHVVKKVDESALPSRMRTILEGMNSEQKTQFLGGSRPSEGGVRKKKSRWDVKGEEEKEEEDYERGESERRREREESRNAERAKRVEYPNDEKKQRRFMDYLNYVRRGLAMPQPKEVSHWEWEKEEVEFESKLLADERALLPDVRARHKPLAKSALALPILDMMRSKFIGETNAPHMASTRDEDRMMAVKSEMFGEKTRIKFEWHPAHGIAKLFNVPNPFPDSGYHGLAHLQNKGKRREENMLSTIGLPSTAAEFAMNLGMGEDRRREEEREEKRKERDREEREERRKERDGERHRYDRDEKKRRQEEDEKENKEGARDEKEERAPDDLLAAIFGAESSDESEDEEEEKTEEERTKEFPSTSQSIPKEKEKETGIEKDDIIRIMDMEDEFGPAPPPGLNQTEGFTGFSVLRFSDEVMKKMRKRKRKMEEKEKEQEERERVKKKKTKKAKKEKKSKKKHRKEKKEKKERRRSKSSSDDDSTDSSVQALD